MRLSQLRLIPSKDGVKSIPPGKCLINTINAHSYNVAQKDSFFASALEKGDYLVPDGASIVLACKMLRKPVSRPRERVAGWDVFEIEMEKLNQIGGKCVFMGSNNHVLALIRQKGAIDYPNIQIATYSPPYKPEFSDSDNRAIINFINKEKPDLLWIGMTAPKQEKWVWKHWKELEIDCHVGTIGAVFDFYAGTVKRAPLFMQAYSLEWLYRLMKEPRRLWRRYILGNILFVWNIIKIG